jgi:hypothetical protein
MRRGLLLLSTVIFALAVAPAATAVKPTRQIVPGQEDVVIIGQCAFPVLAHGEGVEIITTFTDKEGNPVKQIGIFPANTITFTNLTPDTDKSVTVVTSGTFQVRAEPDGSISVKITGHGPFVPNPITGEPGIWYLSGRAFATFDAEGNPTSADLKGSLVNLCAQLA